jgi:hypothetical protein
MNDPVRIAMWSGPRNISTAMMRSFGARRDCAVTDEPFYGAYLKQTGAPQPMAKTVIASMDCDWRSVAHAMRGPVPDGRAIWYQKHMPHHMVGPVDILDFPDHAHGFLIRHPARVVASYAAKRIDISLHDLGYERQRDDFDRIADRQGKAPPVLDSADILRDPEAALRQLCTALGIGWDPAMLHWEQGYRSTDGVWASHWYNKVAESSAFAPPERDLPKLSSAQASIAEAALPFYQAMKTHALTV